MYKTPDSLVQKTHKTGKASTFIGLTSGVGIAWIPSWSLSCNKIIMQNIAYKLLDMLQIETNKIRSMMFL